MSCNMKPYNTTWQNCLAIDRRHLRTCVSERLWNLQMVTENKSRNWELSFAFLSFFAVVIFFNVFWGLVRRCCHSAHGLWKMKITEVQRNSLYLFWVGLSERTETVYFNQIDFFGGPMDIDLWAFSLKFIHWN